VLFELKGAYPRGLCICVPEKTKAEALVYLEARGAIPEPLDTGESEDYKVISC
jgi:hypothetical protein